MLAILVNAAGFIAFNLIASTVVAQPTLLEQTRNRFIADTSTDLLIVENAQDWETAADVGQEVLARALFLETNIESLPASVISRLADQIDQQTQNLLKFEAQSVAMQQLTIDGSKCLVKTDLRGWGAVAQIGERQAGILVPRCTVNAYDTGTILQALYESSRVLGVVVQRSSRLTAGESARYRSTAKGAFAQAEAVFRFWDAQLWNDEFGFYEKFSTPEKNGEGRSPTREVVVVNTNALLALAHVSALKSEESLSSESRKNHPSKLRRLTQTVLNEFLFAGNSRKPIYVSGKELSWPKSWHYSRNIYTGEAGRISDTNHASYDLDFLSLLANSNWTKRFLGSDFQTLTPEQVSSLRAIFLQNVVIRDGDKFLPIVCVNDEDRKTEGKTSRWEVLTNGQCPVGFTKVSTFYNDVGGKKMVSSTGRPRRTAWGWLEVGKDDAKILAIFLQLFTADYLPIGESKSVEGRHRYKGNTLLLLAKLVATLTKTSPDLDAQRH